MIDEMEFSMAIVNEIKCARCDRKYSGVRSRCPYCGARRIGRGKYSQESDNAKGKMIISVLIIAVFAVAAGILLFSTPDDSDPLIPDESPSINGPDDGFVSLPGHESPTPPPATQEPPPPPMVDIRSIHVTHGRRPWNNDSFTLSAAHPREDFNFTIEPPGFDRADDFNIELISTNPEVFEVSEVITGQAGLYGFRATRINSGEARVARLRIVITNNGVETTWETRVHT